MKYRGSKLEQFHRIAITKKNDADGVVLVKIPTCPSTFFASAIFANRVSTKTKP